jgi:hypothetical protein
MLRPVETLDSYRYSCDTITAVVRDSDQPVPLDRNLVQTIMIVKDFDGRIIPLVSVTLQVPREYYQFIQTNIGNIYVNLSVSKYKVLPDSDIRFREHAFSGTFRTINQDFLDTSVGIKIDNSLPGEDKTVAEDTVPMRLYLYDAGAVERYRKMISQSIRGTMTDLLYHLLQPRGFTNVLLSVPDSTDIADRCVPYGNLVDNLKFIDSIYGLYSAPYLFFIDFDTTYLLNKGSLGTTTRPLEYGTVNMYLEEPDSAESAAFGCYIDAQKGQYIVNLNEIPRIEDIDESIEYAKWSKLKSVVSGTLETIDIFSGSAGIEKGLVVNNQKTLEQYKHEITENRCRTSLGLSEIDIGILTPNKLFKLTAHNSYEKAYSIGGDYRLSSAVITLTKQGDSDLNSTALVYLKKQ